MDFDKISVCRLKSYFRYSEGVNMDGQLKPLVKFYGQED